MMMKAFAVAALCLVSSAGCAHPVTVKSALFTYDAALVPAGAAAEIVMQAQDGKSAVELKVSGLLPSRAYGAHLHVKPCAIDPKAAGGHFQHHPDPVATQSPSVDPAYANAINETWLDFTTDSTGAGGSSATVQWSLSADPRPQSVVIHSETTKTEAGKAGTAGARVACMTVTH